MTKTRILASALLAAASFGTMSAANAVVPGSDTYERARDSAAIQSVIEGSGQASARSATQASSAYGYPTSRNAASFRDLVPGSSAGDDAADGAAIMSVITGSPKGAIPAGEGRTGRIVPGSSSF